jgi:phosphate acetyltransferase
MSHFWHEIRRKAAKAPQRILLADGEDSRAIEAACLAQREGIAQPWLIGARHKIERSFRRHLPSAEIHCLDISELAQPRIEALSTELASISKFKDLPAEERRRRLDDPLVLGCLALRAGWGDGFIGGATRTTADTLRAVFSIVGLAPKTSTLFGFFLIEGRADASVKGRTVLLADCAVIPEPSPKQLATIAGQGAAAYTRVTGQAAKVAFLSFSTAGSAVHPLVDRIREARDLARAKWPGLLVDGEWQADAALDGFAATIKGVDASPMAAEANVLVVPDLNCGNIAYKLVQRLGGCRAVGPVLCGTAKPANDLSRGCSAEDILDMIALTTLQAQDVRSLAPAP